MIGECELSSSLRLDVITDPALHLVERHCVCRVRLHHREQAMELYDLSVRLNPRAAQVYYLRGCLKEQLGELNRAIADWQRCLSRHRDHSAAVGKLAAHGVGVPPLRSPPTVRRW